MKNKDKVHLVAKLETKIDFLETELFYINDLLLQCGFSEGIETLKKTAKELLQQMHSAKDLNGN